MIIIYHFEIHKCYRPLLSACNLLYEKVHVRFSHDGSRLANTLPLEWNEHRLWPILSHRTTFGRHFEQGHTCLKHSDREFTFKSTVEQPRIPPGAFMLSSGCAVLLFHPQHDLRCNQEHFKGGLLQSAALNGLKSLLLKKRLHAEDFILTRSFQQLSKMPD